ncbi:oxygenase MpaB family protein [Alcanivorax profundi]|nr:oxygenase MpaB family protein [Alcanivorax profundi]
MAKAPTVMNTSNNHTGARPAPTRVRPFEITQKLPRLQKMVFGKQLAPTRERYDQLVDALWQGDEPMDTLLDWIMEGNARERRGMYDKAVKEGIDAVDNAPQPLKDFFALVDRDPDWLDRELLEEGVGVVQSLGEFGLYIMRDQALMVGYLLSGFNHALVATGALNKGASQRTGETLKWWMDCTEHGGMERFGEGFINTLHVRWVHSMVRRHLQTRKEWDNNEWGIPANQTDMVATYLAFGSVLLLGVRLGGVIITPHESRAVMHLWKYAGWLMGVEEKWLVDSEMEGFRLLRHTQATQSRPDWTSKELGEALSKEPFDRIYPWKNTFPRLHKLYLKYEYHSHLSLTRLFLSREQMSALGLPAWVLPWYPAMTTPLRIARGVYQRASRADKRTLEKNGREQQIYRMKAVFGEREHGIIQPDKNHPAHIG